MIGKPKRKNDEKPKNAPPSRARTSLTGCVIGLGMGIVLFTSSFMVFAGILKMSIDMPSFGSPTVNAIILISLLVMYASFVFPILGFLWGLSQRPLNTKEMTKFFARIIMVYLGGMAFLFVIGMLANLFL